MNPVATAPVVLITGASSGIGAALAQAYSNRGFRVVLVARRTDRLETLARALGGAERALPLAGDVTRDGDLTRAIETARAKFGRVDTVIANAGFGVTGKFEDLSLEDYRRQFETNVFGVLRTIRESLPELKRTRGRIGIIASVASYISLPGGTPYSMSKFALRGLGMGLSAELRPHGVSVTLVHPGFVQSEIRQVDNQGRFHETAGEGPPAWLEVPADRAAREILRGVERRRLETVVTGHGRLLVWLARHAPWIFSLAAHRGLRSRQPRERR